ncbi:acetate/propionate family kinase [Roseovarius sp. S4756]|uniref:acetate/propionate family kinase n=1 Tax=Roseovarius maritimus TaxID=3342637 RepID=UPI00372C43A7
MSGDILTLNAGSSSVKFAVFASDDPSPKPRMRGMISGIGGTPVFTARSADGAALDASDLAALEASADHDTAIALLLKWLTTHRGDTDLMAVGHRVVHGGQHYTLPTLLTESDIKQLEAFVPLAPLHQPHNIAAIRAVAKWQPDVPQIACFDTSFHRSQAPLAQMFALPRALTDEGVMRYGFHGLSYDYIASVLPQHLGDMASGRVVVAHLGNGSSMCAMKDRKSVATSMGFTALDGLMMGRRCGALDPGVVLYLMQAKGMQAAEIETLLYKQSGLLGVSGMTNDMQVLQKSDAPEAREAIELFCYRAAVSLGGLLPAIGGLDALVFTAGIGENSALIRTLICQHLTWLGVSLNEAANSRHAETISAADAPVKVCVLPTNEEAVVANACRSILTSGPLP